MLQRYFEEPSLLDRCYTQGDFILSPKRREAIESVIQKVDSVFEEEGQPKAT
jgi:hypothetical protein